MFCTGTWSTETETLFFAPHSLANLSNHVSYAGTKCAHCTIDSDVSAAKAFDTNGAESIGAAPAAAMVRPVSFRNRRRVTRGSLVVLISFSSRFRLAKVAPKQPSSTGDIF